MPVDNKTIDPDYFYKQFTDVAKDMWIEFERLKRDNITNKTDEGEYLETILVNFLRTYLPKKFTIGRGYIMNDKGETSLQQDIVIYNAENYVLLKNTEGFQVFPIECVYATVEVKSTLSKQVLKDANRNVESIKNLSCALLKVEKKTGDIVDIMQYGSVVFSSIFAFRSNSKLKTCKNNFEKLGTAVDFLFILDKGLICHFENVKKLDKKHTVVKTTTSPSREKDEIMFVFPKAGGPSALILAFLIEHIIAHEKKYGEDKGAFSIYNYLKIPTSTYSVAK